MAKTINHCIFFITDHSNENILKRDD